MRRDLLLLFGLSLLVGLTLMVVINEPGYTDAYYYTNAGKRLATGDGLTDPYLWNYLNPPDQLPAPSHTYWMPLTSLAIATSMKIFGATFTAAQIPSVLSLAGLATLAGWLGGRLGDGERRYICLPGLIVLFGGLFAPFWVTTDSFALYGLLGAAALISIGIGHEKSDWRWFAAAGIFCGLAHLTRADGLLLLLVALAVIWLPPLSRNKLRNKAILTLALISSYLLVMLPWFVRNLDIIDAPLPSGGIRTMYLRGYNEIFAYPVDWSAQNFFEWGWGNILQSRAQALLTNSATWLLIEGLVVLAPFALVALWQRRHQPFLTGFWLYALGLHLVMTFIFAYPGSRGGLFHSSAALLPFWAVLGILGLDAGIDKMVQWRNWKRHEARLVFGTTVVIMAALLGGLWLTLQLRNRDAAPDYENLAESLPADARLMVNDPAAWYYHTGRWGVTLPDAPLDRLPEIARRFCITHLVLDKNVTESFEPLIHDGQPPPDFLDQIEYFDQGTDTTDDDIRIYRFLLNDYAADCQTPGIAPD